MTAGGCPVGCGRVARSGQLLCRPCWARVPPELQADVNRTWRVLWRGPAATHRERFEAYRAACMEAVYAADGTSP